MIENNIEDCIKEKQNELNRRKAALARYEKSIGRDRWYNRYHKDIHILQVELNELLKKNKNTQKIT